MTNPNFTNIYLRNKTENPFKLFLKGIENNYEYLVRILLHRVDLSDNNNEAIQQAFCSGNWHLKKNIISLLLKDCRVDLMFRNNPIYYNAVICQILESGDYELIKQFLTHPKFDPSIDDGSIISHVSPHPINNEIFKLLLEDRRLTGDPSKMNYGLRRALYNTCENGNVEMVELLLKHIKTDSPGLYEALRYADDQPKIKQLLCVALWGENYLYHPDL